MRTAGTRKTFQFKENLQHFIFIAHIKVDKWDNLFGMCNEQVYPGIYLHKEFSSLKDVISSLTSAAKDLINHISLLLSLSLSCIFASLFLRKKWSPVCSRPLSIYYFHIHYDFHFWSFFHSHWCCEPSGAFLSSLCSDLLLLQAFHFFSNFNF